MAREVYRGIHLTSANLLLDCYPSWWIVLHCADTSLAHSILQTSLFQRIELPRLKTLIANRLVIPLDVQVIRHSPCTPDVNAL